MNEAWPWMALLGLGAFHGINPGMGWLFAVALGLQEQRRSAVWNALPPIAVGHALSVGLVVALVALIHASIPYRVLRWIAAAVLIGFGVYRLVRARHPRWVGMRVGFRDLTLWSFLMASAHGAGLMLVPVFLGRIFTTPTQRMARIPGMGRILISSTISGLPQSRSLFTPWGTCWSRVLLQWSSMKNWGCASCSARGSIST